MVDVVMVDDDEMCGEMVSHALKSAGHDVLCFSDGVAALRWIGIRLPGLVILDSVMPEITGSEILHSLKLDINTRAIPIIMLTANKSERDVSVALRSGASDYITKPFRTSEIVARVERLFAV